MLTFRTPVRVLIRAMVAAAVEESVSFANLFGERIRSASRRREVFVDEIKDLIDMKSPMLIS